MPSDLTTSRTEYIKVAAVLSSLPLHLLYGTVTETVDSAQRKQMLRTTPVTRQSVVLKSPAPPQCWRNSWALRCFGQSLIFKKRQTDRHTDRERITTVQASPGLKTFTPDFRPSWGFFKAWPVGLTDSCLLYTSPSPRDRHRSRMPSSA